MNPDPAPPPLRRVGASHGLKWLLEALGMVRRWPSIFLSMGFIVAVISLFPYLGGLAILIMGPTFLAGIVVAADTAEHGQTPATHQLFTLFRQSTRRNETLKLCLPLVIGQFVAAMVLAGAMLGTMSRAGMNVRTMEKHPEKMLALLTNGSMPGWLALALVIVLLAWTFTALAIPCVALGHEPAFKAMGQGFRQVWHSIGAWIVVIVLLFAGLVVLGMLLMLTHVMVIMQLGLYTALYAVLGPLLHAAWRDLGGRPREPRHDPGHGVPPPSAPPPPSGTLEA